VIHLAFNHDFSQFAANCDTDRRVIAALGSVLAGSDRPLIVTSGTAIARVAPGEVAIEDAPAIASSDFPRAASEEATRDVAADGVNTSVVRLPQVHDPERQGLISPWIAIAREKGMIAYVGEGRNRWPAAHISDVARLYRLAIEKSERGAIYNAVGEQGVAAREIAETVGQRLNLPVKSITTEEAGGYFGWLAHLAARDMPASSELTQKKLDWRPTGPGLIADLERLPVS
jgi:nucleoside-diphosphate-sugar epimerase